MNNQLILPLLTDLGSCPEGTSDLVTSLLTGCYSFPTSGQPLNWPNARDYCIAQKGYLVEITSVAESAAIASEIQNSGLDRFNFWIGLTDLDSEGTD